MHFRAKRGFGPLRLAAELRERGIDESVAAATLKAADLDWQSIIKTTWRKKFGQAPTDYQQKAKQARFLEYRGFSGVTISQFLADAENLLED